MRYFCHSCQAEVDGRQPLDDPEGDPECATCGSCFVEKVGQDVESFLRVPRREQSPSSNVQQQSEPSQSTASPSTSRGNSATAGRSQTSGHVVTMVQVGGGRGSLPINMSGGAGGASDILSMILQGTGLVNGLSPNGNTGGMMDEILHQLFMSDQGNAPTPTTPEALAALKRERSDEGLKHLGECGITLEPFESGDVALILPCEHAFKEDAIVQWLQTHNTCPVCRVSIPPEA